MRVNFKFFKGTFTTWDDLFGQAAAFAGQLPPGALINISHSESHNAAGVVVVWYWDESDETTNAQESQ